MSTQTISQMNTDILDYRIRPAKCVERKMFCEALTRLSFFNELSEYQYIGFGAKYFSDFSLFHKRLGMANMISIEADIIVDDVADAVLEEKFKFNKPYDFIEIKPGLSYDVLPLIEFYPRSVVWLDYIEGLDEPKLNDINTLLSKMKSGSVFILTLNAKVPKLKERNAVLKSKLPDHFDEALQDPKDLDGWGLATLYRRIIHNHIIKRLEVKNWALTDSEKLIYKQLFNIRYQDGAMMMSVGGILCSKEEGENLKQCEFDSLDFVTSGDETYEIFVPKLTLREIKQLEKQMPNTSNLNHQWLNLKEIEQFSRIYRYYPHFSEAEI